jgi:hypothetical protein
MVNKLVRSCLQLCISEIPCNDNSACASLNLSKYEATVITTQSMQKNDTPYLGRSKVSDKVCRGCLVEDLPRPVFAVS